MAYKGWNYNVLDMINSARSMAAMDKILLIDHPSWVMKSRVQCRLSLDYSNPGNWNRESLILENVNISATWRSGYFKALSMLSVEGSEMIENSQTTLLHPFKKTDSNVHFIEIDTDWSMPDLETEENESFEFEEDNDDVRLSEIIHVPEQTSQPFFMIEGKRVYKTSVLMKI